MSSANAVHAGGTNDAPTATPSTNPPPSFPGAAASDAATAVKRNGLIVIVTAPARDMRNTAGDDHGAMDQNLGPSSIDQAIAPKEVVAANPSAELSQDSFWERTRTGMATVSEEYDRLRARWIEELAKEAIENWEGDDPVMNVLKAERQVTREATTKEAKDTNSEAPTASK
ncbi:hypothetical protein BDV95DRAFT_595357 [Massariosphaeria phaeospora]|uniref:Uncharacterized protein n=1 Tax=Massariosphaeria phaeospora TaxID=100035 RepID=A0A7C8M8I4_9PLEO|nr:hypothetical protein BDV95DRAFT_595357 [Massariosphaeria phaeospora]